MDNFEYINPPEASEETTNRISNEIKYLEQIIRDIMFGGKK